ncbi:unnamed protein product, partial [Phaeothamnion confervicola]
QVSELDPRAAKKHGVFVASGARETLLHEEHCTLEAGQSRALDFRVGPYSRPEFSGRYGGGFAPGFGGNAGGYAADGRGGNATNIANDDSGADGCGGGNGNDGAAAATPAAADGSGQVVIGLIVALTFQGNFEKHGYRLGRLAANLYRLPPPPKAPTLQKHDAVGFAPAVLQSLHTPGSMGRIMIFHRPARGPIWPGTFRLVAGAASRVR